MNYFLLAKQNLLDPVNNYLVGPIITTPINNYIVNPIQNLVRKDEVSDTSDASTYTTHDSYIPFDSYPSSISSYTPLLEELTYADNIKQKMYYSGLTLKASMYFFVNAWFPNTFKHEGHEILENLKKND
jgi:hypothetical protein